MGCQLWRSCEVCFPFCKNCCTLTKKFKFFFFSIDSVQYQHAFRACPIFFAAVAVTVVFGVVTVVFVVVAIAVALLFTLYINNNVLKHPSSAQPSKTLRSKVRTRLLVPHNLSSCDCPQPYVSKRRETAGDLAGAVPLR